MELIVVTIAMEVVVMKKLPWALSIKYIRNEIDEIGDF